jgi:hypothetical protein
LCVGELWKDRNKADTRTMNLEQSVVLVDRALVTLCAELPESLGLYNTAKDEFTIGALRSIPMLEHLLPESRKHHILRDWMRTYEPNEDQPLGGDISFDSLRETMKKERKQRAKEARERNGDLLSDDDDKPKEKASSAPKANGKAKAKSKPKDDAAAKKKAEAKAKRKSSRAEEVPSDSDVSTSSTPSSDELEDDDDDSSSSDDSSLDDSSDEDRSRRAKKKKRSSSKTKSSSKGKAKAKTKSQRKAASSKSNLPPIEVVLSSDEDDDEPDALFDAEDPDVYEVESILDKKPGRFGEPDKYLIKWVGYEETTWEPAENVSKDLIDEFEGQPVRENEYAVEEILDRKTVRDKETRLKTFKYLVKWVGYDDTTWEPANNLPHNLRRKFDTKYEARKRRRMS